MNANTEVERSNALLQRHDQQAFGDRGEASFKGAIGGLRSDSAFGWDWSYNRQTRFPLNVAGPFDRTDPYDPADTYFLSTPGITRAPTRRGRPTGCTRWPRSPRTAPSSATAGRRSAACGWTASRWP